MFPANSQPTLPVSPLKGIINKIVSGVETIIHTAAYLTPHIGMVSDDKFRDVNVYGTEVLLDLAIRHNLKRFVFTKKRPYSKP